MIDDRFEDRLAQALWVARSWLVQRERELHDALKRGTKNHRRARLTEKDLEECLCEFYDRADTSARRQAPFRSPNWQPKPGGVDLEVSWEQRDRPGCRVWAEIKWGAQNLWNCAWDVAKMALADREGLCDRAYLIAGAAHDTWSGSPIPGLEFLSDGDWDIGRDVLLAHHANWLFWKEEVKTRPLKLPARCTTRVISVSRPFALADGSRWSILVAKVEAPGEDWIEVDDNRRPQSQRRS